MHILCGKIRELRPQQLFQIILRDGGHLHHRKAGGERFVQLPGARVAVVHGGDKAGLLSQRNAVVPGHVDGAAEIQYRVQHRQRLVFGHVDLVQHAEAAALCAAVHRPGTEHHLPARKGIHADEGGGVHVYMKGDVPRGAAKGGGKIFCQHVFAGGLSAGQQQVFAAEDSRQRLFPHLFAVVDKSRGGDTRAQRLAERMGGAVFLHRRKQGGVHPFLP